MTFQNSTGVVILQLKQYIVNFVGNGIVTTKRKVIKEHDRIELACVCPRRRYSTLLVKR